MSEPIAPPTHAHLKMLCILSNIENLPEHSYQDSVARKIEIAQEQVFAGGSYKKGLAALASAFHEILECQLKIHELHQQKLNLK